MSNTLNFILKLTDMLTPTLRQAAAISNTAAGQIEQQFTRISTGGRRMSASIDEVRARLDAVNRVRFSTTIQREFDVSTQAARRLESQLERMEGRGRSRGSGMLGNMLAGFGAYQGFNSTVGAAANREQQQISFGVMAGSKQAGNKMLDDIIKMGAATPYEAGDLIKSAQTLKSFGAENEKILPTLRLMGDIAGGNAEKLNSLSLAYAQVSSAGKLTGQDLLQMVNVGFNPLQQMVQDKLFPSMAAARKAMEHGAIGANMVEVAMKHATGPGGRFFGMMEQQSVSTMGKWSTFMDNVHEKLIRVGEILRPLVNTVIDFGSSLLSAEPGAIALAIAIGGVALAMNATAIATWGVSTAMKIAAGAQAVWNAVTNANPIVLVISLLIALGFWLYSIAKKYEGWSQALKGVWEVVKGFVKLNGIAWKEFGENIWYWIQYAFYKVKGFVEYVGGALGNVWNALKLGAQFKFSEAKAALTAEIKTTASGQLAELEKQHSAGKVKTEQEAMAAVKQMQDGMAMIHLKKKAEPAGAKATNPVTANGGVADYTGGGAADLNSTTKSKADGVNSGGSRPIVINIGKQIESLNVHVMNATEGAQEIAAAVREEMRRMMASLNGVTT